MLMHRLCLGPWRVANIRVTCPCNKVVRSRVHRRSAPSSRRGGEAHATMDKAAVSEHVNRAAAMLDQMLSTIMREMFVDQAAAFVTDERPEMDQKQAVRNAVADRIEMLDANFLAALNGYIQVASSKGEEALEELLVSVREEVLRQVALRLPPPARVLDAVMHQADKDRRLQLLRSALFGEHIGEVEMPDDEPLPQGVDIDEMLTAISNLIEDMEDQEVIADRRLLARMVLVREEIRWLEQEHSYTHGQDQSLAARFARKNVPQRCIAFLKELLLVNDSEQRMVILCKALSQDWDGAAPVSSKSKKGQASVPDFVRPGRFMATLHALESQLVESIDQGVGPAAQHDPQQTTKVLRRLSDVRFEAMTVVDRLQRGQL